MQRCQILESFNNRMLFGMHEGKSIKNIPKHYLKWMWEKGYIKCTKGFFKSFKKEVLSKKSFKYLRDKPGSNRDYSSNNTSEVYGFSNECMAMESMMSHFGY